MKELKSFSERTAKVKVSRLKEAQKEEAYSVSYHTSMMKLSCKNNYRLLATTIFAKKIPSYMFEIVLNTLL